MSELDDFREVPRNSTDAERRALKSAMKQALAAGGGGEVFEAVTRVEKAALSKYGGSAYPDTHIPADILLELDRFAGGPVITGTLARMQGYSLVPISRGTPTDSSLITDAASVIKETGDVANVLLKVISAGRATTAADRHEIIKEATEAKSALFRLVAKLTGDEA